MWFEARLVQNNTVQEQSLPGKGQLKDLSELLNKKLTTCFNFKDVFRCCEHHRQLHNI